jgi:hypothetical protein
VTRVKYLVAALTNTERFSYTKELREDQTLESWLTACLEFLFSVSVSCQKLGRNGTTFFSWICILVSYPYTTMLEKGCREENLKMEYVSV